MRFLAVFLVVGLLCSQAGSAELPESWPDSWKQAYARFEKFLEKRAEYWPSSGLTIAPNGRVDTDIRFEESRDRHYSLALFQDGVMWASCSISGGDSPVPDLLEKALPGPQAACIRVSTPMGYQHVLPLLWFEFAPAGSNNLSLFDGRNKTFRTLPQPTPESDSWPNDRMLAWLDFQVLPHRHPNDIREQNRKIDPAVFLEVGMDGTVHRQKLSVGNAEAALVWRVFYNGRRVESDSAAGTTRIETAGYGMGNFTVLAGVDGPDGFLPASNLLRYSLAPGPDGAPKLLFCHYDYGRPEDYPEWYRAILPPPMGNGPARFSDEVEFEAARKLAAAWRGCADFGNDPNAAWIAGDKNERKIK